MSAVKALLAATKDDRLKRGKYFKYSKELKEEIAAYAMVSASVVTINNNRFSSQKLFYYENDQVGSTCYFN